jgi:integrase
VAPRRTAAAGQDVVGLLYETAARASEAPNLNLEDLDLANKRARVTSKGPLDS